MKSSYYFFILTLVLTNNLSAQNPLSPRDEYNLLLTDLTNADTCGYRSFFNPETHSASPRINTRQGNIVMTNGGIFIAISGPGFLKFVLTTDR